MGEEKIIPTVGRLVYYKLKQEDVDSINKRRNDAKNNLKEQSIGFQVHVGNQVEVGNIVPMIIVSVLRDDCVNGQAFLDGNDTFWVTSAVIGERDGDWDWMPYQKGQAKKTEELENQMKEQQEGKKEV